MFLLAFIVGAPRVSALLFLGHVGWASPGFLMSNNMWAMGLQASIAHVYFSSILRTNTT